MISTTILEQIVTTNLVTVTLAQTQLDLNFQIILKALKAHDSALSSWGNRIEGLEKQVSQLSLKSKQFQDISTNNMDKMSSSLVGVEKQIATINAKLGQIASQNPELNGKKDDIELQNNLKSLEQKIGKLEKKVNTIEKQTMKIASLQRQLQQQVDRITKLEQEFSKMQSKIQNLEHKTNETNQQRISMKDINSLLSELQKTIMYELSKIKSETKNTTNNIQLQLTEINNKTTPIVLNFKQITDELIHSNKQIYNDIWKLNDDLFKHQAQDHPSPIVDLQSKFTDLQTKVNSHLKEHSFIHTRSSSGYKPQISARVQANSSPKDDNKSLNQKQQNKVEERQDPIIIKKQIIDKLKQQRGDFTKALKKLDVMTVKKQQDKFKTNTFEDKLLRLEHLLLGKVDQENLKKWMKAIENKIAYLYRMINVEVSQEDALIARKGWNCLSCDKKLDVYQGKVGAHIASAMLKSKGIDTQIMGGGMLFKNLSRVELPQFKKEK